MDARRTTRIVFRAAVYATVAAAAMGVAPADSARRGLSMSRAEAAARKSVLEDASYRKIAPTQGGLVTRSCWRAPARAVRCSLYVVASSPCALGSDPGTVCAQALWERRWLVEVMRGRHGVPATRILKISSGPSGRRS
jgi:hypothetical protein